MNPAFSSKKLWVVLGALVLFGGTILAVVLIGFSDQSSKQEPITIGVLRFIDVHNPVVEGFKDGLQELGYNNVEYIIPDEFGTSAEIATSLAKEFIEKNVDLIFATGTIPVIAGLSETKAANRTDIPILFSHSLNIVGRGVVASYESSETNATGIEVDFGDLTERKLALLKQIDPNIKKIGYLNLPKEPTFGYKLILGELKKAAPNFDIELIPFQAENPIGPAVTQEITEVMSSIQPGEIDAYFSLSGIILSNANNTPPIVAMTKRLGIPSTWVTPTDVQRGGLFTYQYDLASMGRQSALQADKLLRGVSPMEIPIEFAEKIELFMNFDTIREAGLNIPDSILTLVDKRIENGQIQ